MIRASKEEMKQKSTSSFGKRFLELRKANGEKGGHARELSKLQIPPTDPL